VDIDDFGTVWVNGLKVGNTYLGIGPQLFPLSSNYFHPGKNTIAVRMIDTGGPGGMNAGGSQILHLGNAAMPLEHGQWRWAKGANLAQSTPLPMMGGNPNVPSVLYNGMIAPLVPLAIKGAIWYQGESNAGRAKQYQKLLPAMIGDWRQAFGQGDFPFLIVQLANFQVRHSQPVDDAWAELREAQAMTARDVKNSGLAVAIDIGDRNDIHPKDKQTVGLRLALQALHVAYGNNGIEYSGPIFKAARRNGSTLVLTFEHAQGLNSHGDLKGFQVAGADGTFHWADAKIDGQKVIVSSPEVGDPVYVRYAWDTDPEAALYNGAGLPAVPFRTR
jgi:sialate O-acetylesterase